MKPFLRLFEIILKEIYRDPHILFWGLLFPILMAIGLGLAFSSKNEFTRGIAIVESLHSPNKEIDLTLQSILKNSKTETTLLDGHPISISEIKYEDDSGGKNTLKFYHSSEEDGDLLLKRGMTSLMIKDDHFLFDPRNQESQITYFILKEFISKQTEEFKKLSNSLPTKVKTLEIPGTRYIDYLLPGLAGMGIMMSCLWGLGYTLIERRSKKLLRRLIATPMSQSSYLLSLICVRTLISFVEMSILYLFGILFFHFKIFGNPFHLFLVFISAMVAFSGLAILLSSRTKSIDVGNAIINAFTTPMLILSGVFFSYQGFPPFLKNIIQYLPLTLITDSFRVITLEGGSLTHVLPSIIILWSIGLVTFVIGLKSFKWY